MLDKRRWTAATGAVLWKRARVSDAGCARTYIRMCKIVPYVRTADCGIREACCVVVS